MEIKQDQRKVSKGSATALNGKRNAVAARRILNGGSPTIRGMKVTAIMDGDVRSSFAGVIRLAALNALSVPFFEVSRYTIDMGGDMSGISTLFMQAGSAWWVQLYLIDNAESVGLSSLQPTLWPLL